MAWIESHQNLERHPKLLALALKLNTDRYGALGRLHSLWYWCLDYALDGDLRKFDPESITATCEIPINLLIECGFLDLAPYLRIHDWWDYAGKFIKTKYKDYPEKWKRIERRCNGIRKGTLDGIRNPSLKPSNLTNLTRPNLTKPNQLQESAARIPAPEPGVGERRSYRIPEPKDNPLAALVMYYKAVKKQVPYDDPDWDRLHFARCAKAAGVLLKVCGSYEAAKACLDQFEKDMERADRTWTLETAVRWAHEWNKKQGGKDYGDTNSARFFSAVTEQRTARKFEDFRARSPAGEVSTAVRDLPRIRPASEAGDRTDGQPDDGGATPVLEKE